MEAFQNNHHGCPTCGHRGQSWEEWANRQGSNFHREVTHGAGRVFRVSGQKAKVLVILKMAGSAGITKRQLNSWHLGHWVQKLRERGLAITTEMVRREYPKGASAYAVYRLEEPVIIRAVPPDKKDKKKPRTVAAGRGSDQISKSKAKNDDFSYHLPITTARGVL